MPPYTVVHKQDWHTIVRYQPEIKDGAGFLARRYELHFNERPHLTHSCFLFITKTSREVSRAQSNFSTLCRGRLIPREATDNETIARFMDAVSQFEAIINEGGHITLSRLKADDLLGTPEQDGLLEQYFALSLSNKVPISDIQFDPAEVRIGDNRLCVHTLSALDDLPQFVGSNARYDRLSTDRSDCLLSFAAPVGLLLPVNHIYNQYVFIDSPAETLRKFERTARNMRALSRYSRANAINGEWIEQYLNEAHAQGLTTVRCHCNVFAWSDDPDELRRIKNAAGSALAKMECTPRHNTVDVPTLFWAGIPGNAADFPSEETFHIFLEQALCLWTAETSYRNSTSPFGIKLCDRVTGVPIHVDISDEPMRRGFTSNKHKFIIGPSGSGKSFFVNHLLRQYYEQGAHCVVIDMGGSYKGLCRLINQQTGGRDGIYYEYNEQEPIEFNPFYSEDRVYTLEKRESIKTMLLALWKREDEPPTRAEEVALSTAVSLYLQTLGIAKTPDPSFNGFYEFVRQDFRNILRQKNIRDQDFDLCNFLTVLEPFYKGGEYESLLNSGKKIDLLQKRFVIFELDAVRDHPLLLSVATLIIMETFVGKMRRLPGQRKVLLVEEAWKAIMHMSGYLKYLVKTVRKYSGEFISVTQEVDDLISSPVLKESILANCDCRILLDQRRYLQRFDQIQALLGLTDRERAQIFSMNLANDPKRKYKEVWIGLGGVYSAVYALEVDPTSYLTFTTEESEKVEVFREAEKRGGDLELALRNLTDLSIDNHS